MGKLCITATEWATLNIWLLRFFHEGDGLWWTFKGDVNILTLYAHSKRSIHKLLSNPVAHKSMTISSNCYPLTVYHYRMHFWPSICLEKVLNKMHCSIFCLLGGFLPYCNLGRPLRGGFNASADSLANVSILHNTFSIEAPIFSLSLM